MVKLHDKETGDLVGEIGEDQLQFLIDALEEETSDDTDYYLNRAQLEIFEEQGADPGLVGLLKAALGDREEMEIVWSRG